MFLVHYFDQNNYEFLMSLHSTREAAEADYEHLLRRFVIEKGEPLPPKEEWSGLFNYSGEGVKLYEIACDGEPAKLIEIA